MTHTTKGFTGAVRALSNVATFGLTMGAAILLGYYIGSYLDEKLDTAPWLMLVFILLFMLGAFIKFLQSAEGVSGKNEKKQAGS